MSLLTAAVLVVVVNLAMATRVDECPADSLGRRLSVDIVNCEEPPCVLRRNTNASVQINFVPDRNVEELRNRVFARVWGIPLPFVGVDGESSCDNIYHASGAQAGCPLLANKEYLYKNAFEIRSFYPTISPVVHWGLVDSTGGNVVCFEIKSSIES